MPHVSSGGSEDFFSKDEVKVYKDEGEEEKRSSENLSEDKLGLVTESEEGKNTSLQGQSYPGSEKANAAITGRPEDDKVVPQHPADRGLGPLSYVVSPYPYHNGASVPASLGGKVSMVQPPLAGLMMYNNDYSQPPPAHMGIPPIHIDPKTGLPRPPMYGYPSAPGQFPHPLYGPDFPQVQWQRPPGYPISTGAFSGPYPPSLINTSSLSRFGPPNLLPPPGLPHPGISHPAIITAGPKQEMMSQISQENHRHSNTQEQNSQHSNDLAEKKKQHIKKPLNAFMLFMKEMRPKVVAECTLKESAAINQILGRKWHALDRSEQAKYYEMARKEKELHMQLYPGWSARDNYASHTKKKKARKRDGAVEKDCARTLIHPLQEMPEMEIKSYRSLGAWKECSNPKKCRARFGLDQQNEWCKPCRRKKKCIRFLTGDDGAASNTDGEDGHDDVMSDSIATADSVNESDCNLESPALSTQSDDVHEQQKIIPDIKMESGASPPPVPSSSSPLTT